tara:strand:+ start:2208 stop:3194 length:987 start_codon:yes stop_codon:yes gene_type:complete
MVGGSNTKLNLGGGIEKITDASLSEMLLDNFINFYDWGLVDAGSFYTISIPQSGIYGGDRHKLRLVNEPNYTAGQVWEGYRQNWVWEGSGNIDGVSEQPVDVSGVFVDGSFYANGNVTKPFYIDYPLGRVVFDSAEPTTSDVQVAYSHKRVQVLPGEGASWFRQIQQNSFRTDENFQVAGSGGWIRLGQTRVQLPALAIEVVPARDTQGYQLGGGQWVRSDVVFYIMSENHWEAVNLMDTIVAQNDRTLTLFDTTKVAQSGVSPLTFENGKERELRDHATASGLYPQLVQNYPYRKCWVYDTRGDNITQLSTDLYIGIARCKTEVGPV